MADVANVVGIGGKLNLWMSAPWSIQAATPYEYICKIWTTEPKRFNLDPIHQMPGLNTSPPNLSSKMGKLSQEELAMAHDHVEGTSKYLRQRPDAPRPVVMVAKQRHERLDGSGYPKKLKNGEINNLARMAGIIDVFAALTERRPYRAAMSPFQALEVMQELMREKLDLQMVRIFRNLVVEAA